MLATYTTYLMILLSEAFLTQSRSGVWKVTQLESGDHKPGECQTIYPTISDSSKRWWARWAPNISHIFPLYPTSSIQLYPRRRNSSQPLFCCSQLSPNLLTTQWPMHEPDPPDPCEAATAETDPFLETDREQRDQLWNPLKTSEFSGSCSENQEVQKQNTTEGPSRMPFFHA